MAGSRRESGYNGINRRYNEALDKRDSLALRVLKKLLAGLGMKLRFFDT